MKSPKTTKQWIETREAEGRRHYLREVEAMAVELRPRFLSGELRGWLTHDGDRFKPEDIPSFRLEALCGRRFTPTERTALEVLALSPNGPRRLNDCGNSGENAAREAVALDVLAVAKARGWLAPARAGALAAQRRWYKAHLARMAAERTPEARAARLDYFAGWEADARAKTLESLPRVLAIVQGGLPSAADFERDGAMERAYLDLGTWRGAASTLLGERARAEVAP